MTWDELSKAEQHRIQEEVARMQARPDWPGWREAASRFGFSGRALRWHLDEKHKGKRIAMAHRKRQIDAAKRSVVRLRATPSHHVVEQRVPLPAVLARLAEIPEDTRTLAQQHMGDPIRRRPVAPVQPPDAKTVVWRVTNRNYTGSSAGETPVIEISLPRVRFLEGRV